MAQGIPWDSDDVPDLCGSEAPVAGGTGRADGNLLRYYALM